MRDHGITERERRFKAGQRAEAPKSYDRFVIALAVLSHVAKMASQTQGIQQLLAAEKRAAEKVSDARKRECIRQRKSPREKISATFDRSRSRDL